VPAVEDNARIGRRCAIGCETWPDDQKYSLCPTCGERTQRFRGVNPLSAEEAASLKSHADFEAYLAAHERV
jgi:rRNA maturation endonuclease Nob1